MPRPTRFAALREPGARLIEVPASSIILKNADMEDGELSAVSLSAANLEGLRLKNARVSQNIWLNTTCPDGSNSDDNGGTCCGHYDGDPPLFCSD